MSKFKEGKSYALLNNRDYPAVKCLKAAGEIGIFEREDGTIFTGWWHLNWQEVKPKKVFKGWANLYPAGLYLYESQQEANNSCGAHRVACKYVEIEYEEGEGL